MSNRLYRSRTDRVIGGVAGGLAVWMNVDPSIVRVAWVVLAVFSGGIFALIYFAMMLVVPLTPEGTVPGPGPSFGGSSASSGGAMPGWNPGTGGWTAAGSATGAATGPGSGTAGSASGAGAGGAPPAAPGAASGWTAPAGAQASDRPGGWQPAAAGSGTGSVNAENAGIVVGAVLVLLGIWFLVDQYVDIDWTLLWPVVVIVLGVALIAGAIARGRSGT